MPGEYSSNSAKIALQNGTAELIIVGGISPVYVFGQERFKKKYGVGYNDFGDIIECSFQEMKAYNYTVFEWLTDKYGKKWQKDVRKDVEGFDKWVMYQDAIPYILCDPKPTFNGGSDEDFYLWVVNHMEIEGKYKVSGSVAVNVLLSEEGEIMDVDNVAEQDYYPLTNAFIDAVMKSSQWTPARYDGKPCKVKLTIRADIDYR